jgi:hypothetical protein
VNRQAYKSSHNQPPPECRLMTASVVSRIQTWESSDNTKASIVYLLGYIDDGSTSEAGYGIYVLHWYFRIFKELKLAISQLSIAFALSDSKRIFLKSFKRVLFKDVFFILLLVVDTDSHYHFIISKQQ